jgi:hypothetical protein
MIFKVCHMKPAERLHFATLFTECQWDCSHVPNVVHNLSNVQPTAHHAECTCTRASDAGVSVRRCELR